VTDQTGHSKSLNEMVGAHRARITEMKEVSRLSEDEFETLRVVHPLTHNTESLAQFNALVQKLMLHGDGNNFAVAVTGLSRGVGVSYVALNIAAALAADYRRTSLLIQCNPYPSVLNRMMEPYPDCGLMDYLVHCIHMILSVLYSCKALVNVSKRFWDTPLPARDRWACSPGLTPLHLPALVAGSVAVSPHPGCSRILRCRGPRRA